MKNIFFALILISCSCQAWASIPPPPTPKKPVKLMERLDTIRLKIVDQEQAMIQAQKQDNQARSQLVRLKALQKLRIQEQSLCQGRIDELEKVIGELEARRGVLKEKILVSQRQVHVFLRDLYRSMIRMPENFSSFEREKLESPRRQVLSNLVKRQVREVEALEVDLVDADHLEVRIEEEREQLTAMIQDLREQEGILDLNQKIQADLLERNFSEHIAQLESFRKLKNSEFHVERLIQNFNARRELEQVQERDKITARVMQQGHFNKLKGKLKLPLAGDVIERFGRSFDPRSQLYVFNKGISIRGATRTPVQAVAPGKLVFAGELPEYGKVAIVDHGESFYTLSAHLGEFKLGVGASVLAGDAIGMTDDAATPVHFEIRLKNIAVNPLQWLSN